MKKVFFYNTFHNGDVHLSRTFVRDIMEKMGQLDYTYLHNNNPKIIKDIQNLKHDKAFNSFVNWRLISNYPINYRSQITHSASFLKSAVGSEQYEERMFINTWVGQQDWITKSGLNRNRDNRYCSLYSHYELYQDIFDTLNIKIENIDYYLPIIDFNLIEKNEIDEFIKNNKFDKILLFCNNKPLTLRIELDLVEVVDILSEKNKDVLFVLSNKEGRIINKENIKYFSDIVNIQPDFNELAYFSTFCNIIIGKPSGPYTFTLIKDNFLSEKIFITISDNIYDGFYLDGKSEMILLKEHTINSLLQKIQEIL